MSEALWNVIDDWLVDSIFADLGDFNRYDDLTVQEVQKAIVIDVRAWEEWKKPAIAVIGYDVLRMGGPHGDGEPHLEKRYRYALIVLTEGRQAEAITEAKIILARLETFLRGLILDLNADSDDEGETLQTLEIGSSSITAERLASSEQDAWQVMCGMGIELISEV